MKKNNRIKSQKKTISKIIIIFIAIFLILGSVTVVKNAKKIFNALSFKNQKSHKISKHTPQKLQWTDSFKGISNEK